MFSSRKMGCVAGELSARFPRDGLIHHRATESTERHTLLGSQELRNAGNGKAEFGSAAAAGKLQAEGRVLVIAVRGSGIRSAATLQAFGKPLPPSVRLPVKATVLRCLLKKRARNLFW